jgi:hypothetical protein
MFCNFQSTVFGAAQAGWNLICVNLFSRLFDGQTSQEKNIVGTTFVETARSGW